MRVLYVEDNPANVFLVKRVARMGNHEIINYIDGGQALKKFDEIDPDLVLMDLQLSGDIDGLEAVKMLRDRGVSTPIIAVTAYAMVGDRERCIEAGCTDYLAKPLPIQRLVEIFEEYSLATQNRTGHAAGTIAVAHHELATPEAVTSAPAETPGTTEPEKTETKAESSSENTDKPAEDTTKSADAENNEPATSTDKPAVSAENPASTLQQNPEKDPKNNETGGSPALTGNR